MIELEVENTESEKLLFLYENLFQMSTEGMAVVDHEFCFIHMNKAFIENFSNIVSSKIKTGMNLLKILVHIPQLKNEILLACDKAMLGESSFVTITNGTDNENTYYCYEVHIRSLQHKHIITQPHLLFTIRDISDYKLNQLRLSKQQAALAHAARMNAVGEMASALAHEINQPLAAINVYSYSCLSQFRDKIKNNTKLLRGLERIVALTQHAGEILHKMKNFIREGTLCIEEWDVNLVIKQALAFLDHQKMDLKFEIDLHLDYNLPLIGLDKVKVTQIILNLMQNSIEAFLCHSQGILTIRITTKMDENYIKVIFNDNGPGIPDHLIEKIMRSFFTTKAHGTGLGLPICRTLVEAHGGKLTITPSIREGAEICFTLPLKQPWTFGESHEK